MTRHSRNCTDSAVYSYQEKKKDTKSSGYGTQHGRVGKDSVKDFDCCCLSLMPCRDPMVSPEGYVYDREAILEYFIKKKNEISRALKLFEKEKNQKVADCEEKIAEEKAAKVKSFLAKETSIISNPINPFKKADIEAPGSSTSIRLTTDLPCYWIPSLTPDPKRALTKKPDKAVYCPMTNKPLKIKDLIPIVFTPREKDATWDRLTGTPSNQRYICPLSNDLLGNSVPCVVLKKSGKVITADSLSKVIKKDMKDPFVGESITDKDIIYLQRGGTGYSFTNSQLESTEARAVMPSA